MSVHNLASIGVDKNLVCVRFLRLSINLPKQAFESSLEKKCRSQFGNFSSFRYFLKYMSPTNSFGQTVKRDAVWLLLGLVRHKTSSFKSGKRRKNYQKGFQQVSLPLKSGSQKIEHSLTTIHLHSTFQQPKENRHENRVNCWGTAGHFRQKKIHTTKGVGIQNIIDHQVCSPFIITQWKRLLHCSGI